MKKLIYILPIILWSCSNGNQEKEILQNPETKSDEKIAENKSEPGKKDICWTGTINDKTPVFVHYQIVDDLIFGEIVYLNTKSKIPIRIIGTIEEDKSYRILEFEKNGNISGIITGSPGTKEFNGEWFSPKTRKELNLKLIQSDSVISTIPLEADIAEIYGDYHYQYSEAGSQGDFSITKAKNEQSSFSIFSVTGEPARNIASVESDAIKLQKTEFIYTLPETENCEIKVKFYKGFVHVNYTKGYCEGEFGHNATIDGIFLKTRK